MLKLVRRRTYQYHRFTFSCASTTCTAALLCCWSSTLATPLFAVSAFQPSSMVNNNNDNVSRTSELFSDLFLRGFRSNSSSVSLSKHVVFHHLTEPINSTQDEARRLLLQQQQQQQLQEEHDDSNTNGKAVAVFADIQLAGRGTQGRQWERSCDSPHNQDRDADGNLYLTVGIPMNRIPVTVTLLPLQIGVLVAERVAKLIDLCHQRHGTNAAELPPKVTVKWPNDVLVNDHKISGTLIENEYVNATTWLLVGIGVNVASAPRNLSQSPGKQIRAACCIRDFCQQQQQTGDPDDDRYDDGHVNFLPEQTAIVLAMDLASAIADWVFDDDYPTVADDNNKRKREERIIKVWKSLAEFGKEYELRGEVVDEENGGYQGEKVVTVGIENDGQLRIRGADGRERLLIANYLF